MSRVEGVVHLHYFHDVGYEIDLAALRSLLGAPTGPVAGFRPPAPDYVRFEPPPVDEDLPPLTLDTGESFAARLRYFGYGVARLELDLPFSCGWRELVDLSAKWVWSDRLDREAARVVGGRVSRLAAAVKRPVEKPLREEYAIIEVRRAVDGGGRVLDAPGLLAMHADEIVQIVRGETSPLSGPERVDVLASAMSYFPSDLLVAGYAAAFVYDSQPDGARPVIELLEYANTQLLEFRVYDELLAPVLADAHRRSAVDTGLWSHWRGGREAGRLNALRLEVMELAEKTDNAIKFLADMYHARVYKLAAARVGVPDYRKLVEEKLSAAGELYRFMMDRSHQAGALVLETIVVVILIVDLVMLFRGKG